MLNRSIVTFVQCVTIATLCGLVAAHPADEMPELDVSEATLQYQQQRFGMSIHWGVCSVLADGENIMESRDLTLADYEKLPQFFNPAKFDAAKWVSLAKAAGMQYITFTAKGRDGFAMWNSETSDFNVVDRTPLARDITKDLVDACHRLHLSVFLEYSPRDLHHTWLVDPARQTTLDMTATKTTASLEFTKRQLSELFREFGRIDGIMLNGWWANAEADRDLQEIYSHIRDRQSNALIGNLARTTSTGAIENFHTYTNAIPPEKYMATSASLAYSSMPLEIRDTINHSSAYNLKDHQYKSPRELIHALVRAAGVDANFVLEVGPMPNGEIQPEFFERLQRVGMWMAKNSESIYSTRGGPIAPQPWGVTTHRNHKIYVHVLNPETTAIQLELPEELRTAQYLIDETQIPFEKEGNLVTLPLRPERRGEMHRLLVLETKRYPIRQRNMPLE